MKVMVLVKASKSSEEGILPSEQLFAEMMQFNEELAKAGIMLAGEGLKPSLHGARVRFSGKDRTVINGPFAETKELVAGYWLWEVKSLEEAIDWVKRCPNPQLEDSEIEIRPFYQAEDFGEAFTPELREKKAQLEAQALGLEPMRFENRESSTIAGMNETYTFESREKIPAQWERFAPGMARIPGRVGQDSFGVCWNYKPECGFDYLTGVEVQGANSLPDDYTQVEIPAGRYAVFTHSGHASKIPEVLGTIWNQWVPESGLKLGDGPSFERYTPDFDPATATGGTEIWLLLAGD